ncbi:hypothetical protein RCL1_001421 [Eukaryota sp. TZLM3-RCL]
MFSPQCFDSDFLESSSDSEFEQLLDVVEDLTSAEVESGGRSLPRKARKSMSTSSQSVYVGELPLSITETDLRSVFSEVGEISSVRIVSYPERPSAHAYVNFKTQESANHAVDHFNGYQFDGKPCRVAVSNPMIRKNRAATIYIKGLPKTLTLKQLYDLFSCYGNIIVAKIASNGDTNESLGLGYVQFENEQDAKRALNCTCITLENGEQHSIIVESFKPRTKKSEDEVPNTIFIKNLDPSVTEEELREVCRPFGTISSYALKVSPKGGLKYAMVAFDDTLEDGTHNESENKAIEMLNNSTILKTTTKIIAKLFISRKARTERLMAMEERVKGKCLWVGNLPLKFAEQQLRVLFQHFGDIEKCSLRSIKPGQLNRHGFVLFKTSEAATAAIQALNGQVITDLTAPLSICYWRTRLRNQNPEIGLLK